MELGAETAVSAAALSIDLKLPLADSIILATARKYSAELWTRTSRASKVFGIERDEHSGAARDATEHGQALSSGLHR